MLEDGKLTPEQVRIPEFLEQRTLSDLAPGDVMRVDADLLWYDENGLVWLHGDCRLEDAGNLGGEAKYFVNIIRFEEGFVVNLSSPIAPPTLHPETLRDLIEDDEVDVERMIPVIALIKSPDDIIIISMLYEERYGTTIDDRLHRDGKRNRRKRTQKPTTVKDEDDQTANLPEQD